MTPSELFDLTFTLLNGWLLFAMCILIAMVMLFAAWEKPYKRWNRRIKALNWTFLALVFFADALLSPAPVHIRPWFRIAFFMLLLNEITYHGDVIMNAAARFVAWCGYKREQWANARNDNI